MVITKIFNIKHKYDFLNSKWLTVKIQFLICATCDFYEVILLWNKILIFNILTRNVPQKLDDANFVTHCIFVFILYVDSSWRWNSRLQLGDFIYYFFNERFSVICIFSSYGWLKFNFSTFSISVVFFGSRKDRRNSIFVK